MHQGALARTAGPDDGDDFAAANFEVDIVQYLRVRAFAAIGEADMIELNVSCELRQAPGMRLLAYVVFDIHELEDFAGCAKGLLKIIIELRKFADRVIEAEDSRNKGHED